MLLQNQVESTHDRNYGEHNEEDRVHETNFSFLKDGHEQSREQQVEQRAWEQERPREMHQLIVSEARQRTANPDIYKQQEPYLTCKPKDGDEHCLKERNCKECRD